jgi:UDP-GlcNAc:undecaprenyl-phosphate GlcNAc-1-phosphate transferase
MLLNIMLFIVLLGCELIYFKIADRYNIIDKPNERSLHTQLTIRGGGIIFWIASLFYFVSSDFEYPWFFLGVTAVATISFADDIFTLSNRVRLPIQVISMGVMLFQLDVFSVFNPFLVLLIWIVGVGIINAYNFMDGINGITGGYSSIVLLALLFVNNNHIKFINSNFIITLLLGLLVFNLFNFRRKARCFAGDVGSISIAFVVLFLIIKVSIIDQNPIYLFFLTVYGVDSIATIIQRLWLKQNIFKAHRLHLFQIIVHDFKVGHIPMALCYMICQGGICLIIIANLGQPISKQLSIAFCTVFGSLLIYIALKTYLIKIKNNQIYK